MAFRVTKWKGPRGGLLGYQLIGVGVHKGKNIGPFNSPSHARKWLKKQGY
jgi:hypothetical protein